MIEVLGIKLSYEAAAFLILFIFDELVPYLPIKGNNLVQVIQGLTQQVKIFRKEDDAVRAVKAKLAEIQREVSRLK
jgi:hypothetical protein